MDLKNQNSILLSDKHCLNSRLSFFESELRDVSSDLKSTKAMLKNKIHECEKLNDQLSKATIKVDQMNKALSDKVHDHKRLGIDLIEKTRKTLDLLLQNYDFV